jgi:hypothetical protein
MRQTWTVHVTPEEAGELPDYPMPWVHGNRVIRPDLVTMEFESDGAGAAITLESASLAGYYLKVDGTVSKLRGGDRFGSLASGGVPAWLHNLITAELDKLLNWKERERK